MTSKKDPSRTDLVRTEAPKHRASRPDGTSPKGHPAVKSSPKAPPPMPTNVPSVDDMVEEDITEVNRQIPAQILAQKALQSQSSANVKPAKPPLPQQPTQSSSPSAPRPNTNPNPGSDPNQRANTQQTPSRPQATSTTTPTAEKPVNSSQKPAPPAPATKAVPPMQAPSVAPPAPNPSPANTSPKPTVPPPPPLPTGISTAVKPAPVPVVSPVKQQAPTVKPTVQPPPPLRASVVPPPPSVPIPTQPTTPASAPSAPTTASTTKPQAPSPTVKAPASGNSATISPPPTTPAQPSSASPSPSPQTSTTSAPSVSTQAKSSTPEHAPQTTTTLPVNSEVKTVVSPPSPVAATSTSTVTAPEKRIGPYRHTRAAELDGLVVRLVRANLFSDIPAGKLVETARQIVTHHFRAAEPIFDLHSTDDVAYLIVEGHAQVRLPSEPTPVAALGPNDLCGEIGAYFGGPRPMSVLASTDMQVLAIPGPLLRGLAQDVVAFREKIVQLAKKRAFANLVRSTPSLRDLSASAKSALIASWQERLCEPGTLLLLEGEVPEGPLIIAAGIVDVYGGDLGHRSTLTATAGNFLGITASSSGEPSGVSARTKGHVLLASLPRAYFLDLAQQHLALADLAHSAGSGDRGIIC